VQGFRPPTFDHQKTAFALDGRHGSLACEQCHGYRTVGANRVVLFEKLGQGCVDCHRSPHSKRMARCLDCHNTNDWKVRAF
jgi:hypothetical protein